MTLLKNAKAAATYHARDERVSYYSEPSQQQDGPFELSGKLAQRLDIEGPTDYEQLYELFDGQLPDGQRIARGPDGTHRSGIDLTYSAPKSFSIIDEVGGDKRLDGALSDSIAPAIRYMEEYTAAARITEDGEVSKEATGNLLIGRAMHHTSRANDPHTHEHVVVFGLTQRQDGKIVALSNDLLFQHRSTISAIQNAELALMTRQLGYEVERTHSDGRWEVRGVSQEVIKEFSQRRQVIEQVMEERGLSGPQDAERVTLLTRQAKSVVDYRELSQEWQERAQAHGLDLERMVLTAVERTGSVELSPVELRESARQGSEWAIEHLTERQTVIEGKDIIRHALEQEVGKTSFLYVREAISELEKTGELVLVGKSQYTTLEALQREYEVLARMENGKGVSEPILKEGEVLAVSRWSSLTPGQQDAVVHVMTSRDQILGIEGFAGVGKTTVMREIHDLAGERGITIRGLAVTASAANTLAEEAGIQSRTVASFLAEGHGRSAENEKTIYIADESSLIGMRQGLDLIQKVQDEGARLVLVGDRAQLSSIEAGQFHATLVDRGMSTVEMRDIVRQTNSDLRETVQLAAEGQVRVALERLEENGRVVELADRAERLGAVASEYIARGEEGRGRTLVLTGTRADRAELNQLIRTGLKEEGTIRGQKINAEVLVQKSFTKAQSRDAGQYQAGDMVKFQKTYPSLGVEAHEYGRVVQADVSAGMVELKMESGGRVVQWQPDRVAKVEVYSLEGREIQEGDQIRWTRNLSDLGRRNGESAQVLSVDPDSRTAIISIQGEEQTLDLRTGTHWDHSYATTVHSAQGKTAEHVIYHVTAESAVTSAEAFYVSVSRARESAMIFTDDREGLRDAVQQTKGHESAMEAVEPAAGKWRTTGHER
nr:MobF family relaxase [Candidatus Nitrospira nitrificans]